MLSNLHDAWIAVKTGEDYTPSTMVLKYDSQNNVHKLVQVVVSLLLVSIVILKQAVRHLPQIIKVIIILLSVILINLQVWEELWNLNNIKDYSQVFRTIERHTSIILTASVMCLASHVCFVTGNGYVCKFSYKYLEMILELWTRLLKFLTSLWQ